MAIPNPLIVKKYKIRGKRRSAKIARVSVGRSQRPSKGGVKLPAIINPKAIHTFNCISDLFLSYSKDTGRRCNVIGFARQKKIPEGFGPSGINEKGCVGFSG
jgi:hypothetical protein